MREILFRAKRVKKYCATQDWTYGVPFIDHEGDCIFKTSASEYVVDPETVGQYTGLTVNGTKIFEGDIVKATFSYNNFTQDRVERRTATYEVRYNEKYCYFYLAKRQNNMLFDGNWTYCLREIEVIGNIHDNPELLEGGTK